MRTLFFFASLLLLSSLVMGQSPPSTAPQIVDIPSGKLRLKGFLWKPPGPARFPLYCSITVREAQTPPTRPE